MANSKPNIVVVDDDPGMNQAIERLLNAAGFHAITFASAEDLLADGAAADAACLVVDVHLTGVSGFELQRRLQKSGVTPPVIFVTAYDESRSRAQAQDAGAIAYFIKPFPGKTLLAAITRAINPGPVEPSNKKTSNS